MYQETIVVDRLIVVVSNSTKQGYKTCPRNVPDKERQ